MSSYLLSGKTLLLTLLLSATNVRSSQDWDMTIAELSSLSWAASRPKTSMLSSLRSWVTLGVSLGEEGPECGDKGEKLALNLLILGTPVPNCKDTVSLRKI